ncbi:MAG: iron-containing alcohol dehydrogenase [Candidatus Heimdallarchaeaceae archaeon]
MIPRYYEFYNQTKILSGFKALENLPNELKLLGSHKPLILTDRGIEKAGLLKTVLDACSDSDLELGVVFTDIPQDSSTEVVEKLADIYRTNNCDTIIAIGGGSVIDTAKVTNILVSDHASDLKEVMGVDALEHPLKPLVVIPTTAGTGSEVTTVAMIKDYKRNMKLPFTSQFLAPNVAILDPRMTLSLPPFLTAATAMDALTHAIEAYTSLQKNPISDAYAWSAIKLISENLVDVVKNGKNAEKRLKLANAALIAGICFTNAMVGVVHSLGHALGGVAKIPHGVAMNIFLPYGLEYNFDKIEPYLAELLLPLAGIDTYVNTPAEERASKTIAVIRELRDKLYDLTQLPRTLTEAKVNKSLYPQIAQAAIDDGSLALNPKDMSYEDALGILEKAT